MDFESRFKFETNLPAPRQISTIKRRKSFSEKFFKKTGVQLKLAGKNTLKIRQKLTFKERVPALQVFNGPGNSCRSNPTTPQEISAVTFQNPTALSFPQLTLIPDSSMVINCATKVDEAVGNATALSSVNAESEWVNGQSLTDCKPIVLSSTADSYLPVSSKASFITLHRRRDKSPGPLIKQSGDKFDTFRRSNFVLNYESETPSFSTINKNHINKSVVNGSIQFNVSSADMGCSFDGSSYDTFPSLDAKPRLSITSPTLSSLKSFDSNTSPLAKSTPVSFGRDSNKLSVSRTNFTCRVIPNSRTNTPANRHRNSCSLGLAERDAVANKLNRHSICDIPLKDIPFPNDEANGISKINPNAITNSFQQELMARCSRSLTPSQSKLILSLCNGEKPTIPVKPCLLKNQERSSQDCQMTMKPEKEINNNSIFIVDQENLNNGINLKSLSDAFPNRPDIPCKPAVPTCKKPDIPSGKPIIPTCKPDRPISSCKPLIPTCKPHIYPSKPQITSSIRQIPTCKSQLSTSKAQSHSTHKLDIFLCLSDAHRHIEAPVQKHVIEVPEHEHVIEVPEQEHVIEVPEHEHVIEVPEHEHVIEVPEHEHVIEVPEHEHVIEAPVQKHVIEAPAQKRISVPVLKHLEVPAITPKPILKQTLCVKKSLEMCSKIPLDNILKKQLKDSFNNEKTSALSKSDSLTLSQSMKVRELVSTFNNVLKLPQTEYDKEIDNFQNNFTGKTTNDWKICNSSRLPLPLGPLCGSIEFLRKRSLIEEKLPNMISLVANGSSSLRTQI